MSVGKPRATRARRIVWWSVGALAIVVVLAGAWVGIRGLMAKSELESLSTLSRDLTSALSERDLDRAVPLIDQISGHAEQATALTGDPVWALAELIPFLGPNLQAVRISSAQVDAVMRDGAAPVVDAVAVLKTGLGDDGALDITGLAKLAPKLKAAVRALDDAAIQLNAVDTNQVIAPLASGVTELGDAVAKMRPAVDALARASVVLPAMLGTEQPASVLVMAQNNAELRTGGGITGTFVEFSAENGQLSMVAQADSFDFPVLQEPIVSIPESTTALYGPAVGRWVQNASTTPDFDLTAAMASARWRQLTGHTPDFVVSVDPLVLRGVLSAIGPVKVSGGELSADNMIQRVLVDPYLTLDQSAQTALFQETVAAVFKRVSSGDFDAFKLLEALAKPIEQGRISVWSADAKVQSAIDDTAFAGPASRQQTAGDSAFAVYLNDTTGGKMGVFLDVDISAGIKSCRADGLVDVLVSVELTSTAPANGGAKFPYSVTGGGNFGVPAGDIGTLITVAAPKGSFFGGVKNEGVATTTPDVIDAGFPSSATQLVLRPGQHKTAEFRFTSPSFGSGDPIVLNTPLLKDPTVTYMPSPCG